MKINMSNPELVLIRRALRIYAKTYEQFSIDQSRKKDQWERDQDKQYAAAADALCNKLMPQALHKRRAAQQRHRYLLRYMKREDIGTTHADVLPFWCDAYDIDDAIEQCEEQQGEVEIIDALRSAK